MPSLRLKVLDAVFKQVFQPVLKYVAASPPPPVGYQLAAVDLNGSTDFYNRLTALAGLADSKKFTFCAWVNPARIGAAERIFSITNGPAGSVKFTIIHTITNTFQVFARDAASATILDIESSVYPVTDTWFQLLVSIDLSSAFLRHFYVTGVSDLYQLTNYTDAAIGFTVPAGSAISGTSSGMGKFEGCVAQVAFWPGSYIDLDIDGNRLGKFIEADGGPVDFGADGSLPFGVVPVVYQNIEPGDPLTDFAVNKGSGGNYTVNGTPILCATAPEPIA